MRFIMVAGQEVTPMMWASCHPKHQQAAELRQAKGHAEGMG
jgi:hypothetical protein